MSDLAALLNVIVFQYGGTRENFARAAKITRAQLSHYMNPKPGGQRPGVLVCLKIAHAGHCSAERVLRAAGQHAAADLYAALSDSDTPVVGMTGSSRRRSRVRPQEIELLQYWRALDTKAQKALTTLIQYLATGAASQPSTEQDAVNHLAAAVVHSKGGS